MTVDGKKNRIIYFLLPVTYIILTIVASFLYKKTYGLIIRNTIMEIFAILSFLYSYDKAVYIGSVKWYNRQSPLRIYIIMLICGIAGGLMPLLPESVWPIVPIFALISMASDTTTAIIGGISVLLLITGITDCGFGILAIYFLAGVFAVLSTFDTKAPKITRLALNIIAELVLYSAMLLFYVREGLTIETIIMPIANIMITTIILYIIIMYIRNHYTEALRNQYKEVEANAKEALDCLKQKHPDLYFKSLHASHFAAIMASEIDCNEELCRLATLYYNADSTDEYRDIYETLPEQLREIIGDKNRENEYISIEQMISGVAVSIVDSIYSLDAKERETQFESSVTNAFKKAYEFGRTKRLDITFSQFERLRNKCISEKKYLKLIR